MYEVASGTNVNSACCSDFGNVETDTVDTGAGHIDTLNLSTLGANGATGHGPWAQVDLEEGVFQGKTAVWTPNQGNASKFVTAVLKNNGVDTFALKGGNSQSGGLSTWYNGALPDGVDHSGNAWKPMKLEGSIGLGAGGDNSNRGTQSFFEGVMTSGYASDATENSVQSNIVALSNQGVSTGGGPDDRRTGREMRRRLRRRRRRQPRHCPALGLQGARGRPALGRKRAARGYPQHARPLPRRRRQRDDRRDGRRTVRLQRSRRAAVDPAGRRVDQEPRLRPLPGCAERQHRQRHASANLDVQRCGRAEVQRHHADLVPGGRRPV
jgi:hypothetical protein